MILVFRLALLTSVLPIVVVLALASVSNVAGAPMTQVTDCPVSLVTTATDLLVGDEFDVDIVLDASLDVPVNGVEAHVNFDPAVLQVVDVVHATGPITPGGVFIASPDGPGPVGSTGDWTDVLKNTVDNAVGEVRFAGGKGTSGTDATDTFVLATVRFQALAASPGTAITFGTDTKVTSGTNVVTGTLTDLTVIINDLVDVTFNMTLQGRSGSPGSTAWTKTFDVEIYETGTINLVDTFNPTTGSTDTNAGSFLVSGVTEGTYDIWFQGANTLSGFLTGVPISPTSSTVDLGEQIGGDSNGDNEVNSLDYSGFLTLAETDFGSATADLAAADQGHDHDLNDRIGIVDYAIIVHNFGAIGNVKP